MNRPELRVALDEPISLFCRCGNPEDACASLLRLLRLHPLHSNRPEFEEWVPDDGLQMLLLGILDGREWNEHGGSIGGAWLTPLGEAIRDALTREEADGFEAFLEPHCVHGYDSGLECPSCCKLNGLSRPVAAGVPGVGEQADPEP